MIKRVFDLLVSCLALVLLFPVMLLVAFKVRRELGTPVLFRQVRPGLNGKPFEMIKFRTMKDSLDSHGVLLPDTERLTTFGKRLRETSLDELPELYNVLKGDMSLVGPRPLSVIYIPYYTPEEFKRHDVKPGITGLAQVKGRNNLSWEEKFKFDIEYVQNQSIWLDIKILCLTVYKVIKPEGVGQGVDRPVDFHETRSKKYR